MPQDSRGRVCYSRTMNVVLRKPRMTRAQFLDWAAAKNDRYEFDGFEPRAMTGGTIGHNLVTQNIYAALRARMRGSPCKPLGPDAGVATIGEAVRYPDALVTCSPFLDSDRLVPGVVIVFEVLGSSSDRIDKVIEYRAVPSIRRYIVVESTTIGLTVYRRDAGGEPWMAGAETESATLSLPEIGIEIPIAEFYEGTALGT